MFKKTQFLRRFIFATYVLSGSIYAIDYTNASFYVNYDSEDPTQYALVMPSVNKIFTHKAGKIQPGDLTQVDEELESFPTYTNGELCFPALKTGAIEIGGVSKMAGNCYDVNFFYVQKEAVSEGVVFMLYYDVKDKLQEGLAGRPATFKTVKEGDTITNANSITEEDYTYFNFDRASATVSIGKPTDNNVDTIAPEITLNGDTTVRIMLGETYTDAGATATDNVDTDVKVSVDISSVNTSAVGEYTVTITAIDSKGNEAIKTRTVIVELPEDTVAPKITLLGANPLEIVQGDTFADPGATAKDNRDGVVAVIPSGDVDMSKEGEYTITYTAVDEAGNEATATRVVKVIFNGVVHEVTTVREFRKALENAAANGVNDAIELSKGVYNIDGDGRGTFTFTDQQDFNLTIRAAADLSNSDVVLDGNTTGQVFSYQNSSVNTTLILQGITITNALETGAFSERNTIIEDCNISNNGYRGFSSNGNTIVKNSLFSKNLGGGLFSGGTTDIESSIFVDNNHSTASGAGFYSVGNVVLKNSTLKNNKVLKTGQSGGGFYTKGTALIEDSNLTNNYSSYHGGACRVENVTTVKNSIFTENSAFHNGATYYKNYGGAINTLAANIKNSKFINNSITANGVSYGGAIATAKVCYISGSTFKGNSAKTSGGAMFNNPGGSYMSGLGVIVNSQFENNNAEYGAGVYAKAKVYYVVNNTFVGNSKDYTGTHTSAAIKTDGVFVNNIFEDNYNDIYTTGDAYTSPVVDYKIYNNYIDYDKLHIESGVNVVKKNNLEPIDVGEVLFEEDGYALTMDSQVLDLGLNPSGTTFKDMVVDEDTYNEIIERMTTDIAGNSRVYNDKIDMGAYEYQGE